MSTLLYITANPRGPEASYGLAVGQKFLEAYRKENPNDIVVHLDLFKEYIPFIDADVFDGWEQLSQGTEFTQLSSEQQSKIGRMQQLLDQFVAAHKYVFVTPLWNLSTPPVFKAYIDCFCVQGATFQYTAQGPVGLLTGKKAVHIQASGGVYSHGPAAHLESGNSYLKNITKFIGIDVFESIFVEGMASAPDQVQDIKEKAFSEACMLAKTF
jgi:FMN-dependent NADH-azoreductase